MIDGSTRDFIEKLYYEDHHVVFNDEKFIINGCQTRADADGNTVSVRLEVYNLTLNTTVFSATKPSAGECVKAFENADIWAGKTFWDAEAEIEWVDE